MRIFKNEHGYTLAVKSERWDNWEVYEMDYDPLLPQGVNQYSCNVSSEQLEDLDEITPKNYYKLPAGVMQAILMRLAHYSIDKGYIKL